MTDSFQLVRDELARAREKFPPMRSPHEGYAILLEEVEELKAEVFHGTPERAREEAIQVAAMALRFIEDCTDTGSAPSAVQVEHETAGGAGGAGGAAIRASDQSVEAALKVCGTCKGRRHVPDRPGVDPTAGDWNWIPCPDCAPVPPSPDEEHGKGWVRTGEVDTGWAKFKRAGTWEREDGSALHRVPVEVEQAIRAEAERRQDLKVRQFAERAFSAEAALNEIRERAARALSAQEEPV